MTKYMTPQDAQKFLAEIEDAKTLVGQQVEMRYSRFAPYLNSVARKVDYAEQTDIHRGKLTGFTPFKSLVARKVVQNILVEFDGEKPGLIIPVAHVLLKLELVPLNTEK